MFAYLGRHDQGHLVAAHDTARDRAEDPELHLAVLLHDIGKVTLSGQRVSLGARVFAVLGNYLPRSIRSRIRADRDGAWLTGPWLAEHHALIGAERLRALGLPEHVCRLVELHDDPTVSDDRLRVLREIDSATI